jgi:hypothetical protein
MNNVLVMYQHDLHICFVKLSQTTTIGREDDVKDADDDDFAIEMNKQVICENLSQGKAILNYN